MSKGMRKNEMMTKGAIDWFSFLYEKINVKHLKKEQNFPRRIIKFPSIEYANFVSFFGQLFAFNQASFIEEDFMNYANDYYSIEEMDKLFFKYPNSYQLMFFGIVLFHHFVEKNEIDRAMIVSDKLFKFFPYDLNMVMLKLQIADLYKNRNNDLKYKQAREEGLKMAKTLNIHIEFGVDKRFVSPEKTWQLLLTSLRKGDIDAAMECFLASSQSKFRPGFTAMKDRLNDLASGMGTIHKIKIDGNKAEYSLHREENGEIISYGVHFTNIFGEWKIDFF